MQLEGCENKKTEREGQGLKAPGRVWAEYWFRKGGCGWCLEHHELWLSSLRRQENLLFACEKEHWGKPRGFAPWWQEASLKISVTQCGCLSGSLCLGWPLVNKLASHAHQLFPLCDGDNDVLLRGYQRQTQQTASEQSWILSREGEWWVGSGPGLLWRSLGKVPVSPICTYCGWFLFSREISSCLSVAIAPQPIIWCCIFNHIPRSLVGKNHSHIPTGGTSLGKSQLLLDSVLPASWSGN